MPTIDITQQAVIVEAPAETSVVSFTQHSAVVEVSNRMPVVEFASPAVNESPGGVLDGGTPNTAFVLGNPSIDCGGVA